MTYSTDERETFALPLPITQRARAIAQQFASEQPNREKAHRVRLNTLAVSVVNDYLQMLGISTDLEASDSWNPVLRLCADVADLEVTGVGRLECRPMTASQRICPIPQEVWELRVGYVVVQIDEEVQEAQILGFTPTAAQGLVSIEALQPPEDLIDRLHQLREAAIAMSSVESRSNLVNLSQWFNQIFEAGWEAVETFMNPTELTPAFSFRGRDDFENLEIEPSESEGFIRRAKAIDLGIQLAGFPVVLIVELRAESEQRTEIGLQVHPSDSQTYLPSGLELSVLDESGEVFMEAQSRTSDNYIQLQFRGEPGEGFRVKVAFEEASVTEDFNI